MIGNHGMIWGGVGLRCALWLVACLVCAITITRAATGSPKPLSVVLWLHDDSEQALVERVHGQTSDLDISLAVVRATEELGPRAGMTVRAWELARDRGADVVVWLERPDPGIDNLTLLVAVPARQRLLVRTVGDGSVLPAPGLGTATLEAAALVIRAALGAAAAGDSIGVETRPVVEPAPEPTPTAAPTAVPTPPPPPPRESPTPAAEPTVAWRVGLYWDVSSDGVAPYGHHGPGLTLGPSFGRLELDAFANLGLASPIDTDLGELTLSRHALGLHAGVRLALSRYLEWTPGLRLGLVAYRRSAGDLAAGVTSTADRLTYSMLVGPEGRFGLSLGAAPVRLSVAAGLDLVPQVLRPGFQYAGRFEPAFATARLQPRISLGAEMRLGE